MNRLLLDQGLPRSTAGILRNRGWDVLHVGELGMARSTDGAILEYALGENRIVVTLDADFHALLALSGANGPSVIRIREEGLKGPELADLLVQVVGRAGDELVHGAVATVQSGKLRIKRLPISP